MPTNVDEVIARILRLFDEDKFTEARALLTSIRHQIHPGVYEYNVALIVARVGKMQEALEHFERAIAECPNDPRFHWGMSLAALAAGNFERGWKEFEWRLKLDNGWQRDFLQPQWTGQEDLTGKTILLHAEGGLGDALQFVRYVPMFVQKAGTVILECQPGLVPLFSGGFPGLASVYPRGPIVPQFDYHCPLQSLPRAFGTTLRTIPKNVPYLAAPAARLQAWHEKLGPPTGARVGLVWCGSGNRQPKRSRTLATFAPFNSVPGIEFHSLQAGPEAAEERPAGMTVIDHAAELTDFVETAALASQMDLIISVDTSVAHLAGALARETWVLLAWDPDFRWLRERDDSPWYPTMRLFRQAKLVEHWDKVVEQIVKALGKWMAARKNVK
ncbi:MAG TPA: tetratricopeptide repeat-containing glycosyltransferase family protein [Humisphaera sp.]|jgi:hypothetical protein|nr:tetratricopeptide repeat-containing glycosyltransferase family protein [Humisphaera sp.]